MRLIPRPETGDRVLLDRRVLGRRVVVDDEAVQYSAEADAWFLDEIGDVALVWDEERSAWTRLGG